MSRHKLVKTLNFANELDDFDGGANYNDSEEADELSAEDKEQLQDGTVKVRSILGSDISVTDEEIQESLWHYYYDVAKTINYILNQKTSQPKISKRRKETGELKNSNGLLIPWNPSARVRPCYSALADTGFFQDSPWLNVPEDRRGEILIKPLYPPGRLLGGSPPQAIKVSKLAALTAARKRKEKEKNQDASYQTSTAAATLLDKLGPRTTPKSPCNDDPQRSFRETDLAASSFEPVSASQTLFDTTKKRKNLDVLPKVKEDVKNPRTWPTPKIDKFGLKSPLMAPPSMFARTIFGISNTLQEPSTKRLKTMMFPLPQGPQSYTEFNPFAGPSPDDIVQKAQSTKGLKQSKGTSRPQNVDKSINDVTQGVSTVALEDILKAKSKNLDVVAEFEKSDAKNSASFVVIGHVDAGKSTLMGRLLYDLNVVDQRTIDKYRREAENIGKSSFALAWVLDQGTEERNRGVTVDIATNKFETAKTNFTILDAPGHRDFIPNMIAGASQADFAVLVIDASTGSFESGLKGQTKEHALLVRSMGVVRLIVAVNKLDTVNWSQERFLEISTQISAFLTAAGFLAKNLAFVPCSGLTGENIVQPSQNSLLTSWYQGPPLLTLLDASEPFTRALEKPLRLTVNDIFRGGVTHPLSIAGRIDSGSVQTGDTIVAMPSAETALIKAIEVDAALADWAVAGQNATLHLADIDAKFIKSGDVICTPTAPVKNIATFTTKILAFGHVIPMHVEVHRGRLHTPGRIIALVAVLDKGSGAVLKKKPRLVQPGSVARVVVELEEAVPLEAPGRIVLRAGGETIAAGLLE